MQFIFITGAGRCGTNLIRGIIDGHDEVNVMPGEINILEIYQRYLYYDKKKFNKIAHKFLKEIYFNKVEKERKLKEILTDIKKNNKIEFVDLIKIIIKNIFNNKKKKVLINKKNENISQILMIFNKSKIIHMLRNPLSQINSRYLFRYASVKNNFSGLDFFNAYKRNYISFEQAIYHLNNKQVKIFKMEDIIQKKKFFFLKITRFLKINNIQNYNLTEFKNTFESTIRGRIQKLSTIKKINTDDASCLLPNDLYYCSLILPAKRFYLIKKYKYRHGNFFLFLYRHLGLLGKHRTLSLNIIIIIKKIIYSIHNYIADQEAKREFEGFLNEK